MVKWTKTFCVLCPFYCFLLFRVPLLYFVLVSESSAQLFITAFPVLPCFLLCSSVIFLYLGFLFSVLFYTFLFFPTLSSDLFLNFPIFSTSFSVFLTHALIVKEPHNEKSITHLFIHCSFHISFILPLTFIHWFFATSLHSLIPLFTYHSFSHSHTHSLNLFLIVTQFFTFTHTSIELWGGAKKARDWGTPNLRVGRRGGEAARDADFGGRVASTTMKSWGLSRSRAASG